MSNLGMRILYGVMNNIPGVWCERVFAPWGDMEAELRQAEMPFLPWNPAIPSPTMTLWPSSVGYEMAFPAILNMLDLAHIPSTPRDRTGLTRWSSPAAPPCTTPEPLADFIDLVSLGEGEDVTVSWWSSTAAPAARAGARPIFSAPLPDWTVSMSRPFTM